jgi:hypothetical protein
MLELFMEILVKMTQAEAMRTVGKDFTTALNEAFLSVRE